MIPLFVIAIGAFCGWMFFGDVFSFDWVQQNREQLLHWRQENLLLTVAGFVGLYVLIVGFSLPGAGFMSVLGGFLFGLTLGCAVNVVSATLGAILVFWAAKMGFGDSLAQKYARDDSRVAKIRGELNENAMWIMLALRLVPVFPFFMVNLLAAIAGIRLGVFVWTTIVGILPGALLFTSLGQGLGLALDQGQVPNLGIVKEPYIWAPLLGLAALALRFSLAHHLAARLAFQPEDC